MQPGPQISVIVPTYNASATITRCLESVLANSCPGGFEVIVVDSSTDDTPRVIEERFPEVKLGCSNRRLFPGEARNRAIAYARGGILAFTDADCVVDERWLEEVSRAHRSPTPAIGGVIDNANPDSYVGWASYLCKFAPFAPPATAGPVTEIPTCCLSIKREAFDACGPFLEGTLSSDTAFSWRLGRMGNAPWLDPSIRVAHVNRDRLHIFLANLLRHGRHFAAVRVAEQGFSGRRRLAYAALCPLLPFLLLARTAGHVLRGRRHVGRFLLASPLVTLGHAAWVAGELRGYLLPNAPR